MDFASGGLSDEQRGKGELAKGGIVNPQTWRTCGEGPDGFYTPQDTKRHSVALLLKTTKAMGFGGENGDK